MKPLPWSSSLEETFAASTASLDSPMIILPKDEFVEANVINTESEESPKTRQTSRERSNKHMDKAIMVPFPCY